MIEDRARSVDGVKSAKEKWPRLGAFAALPLLLEHSRSPFTHLASHLYLRLLIS